MFRHTEPPCLDPSLVREDVEDYWGHSGRGRKILPPPAFEDLVPRPSCVRRLTPPEKQANPNGRLGSLPPRRKGRRLQEQARKMHTERLSNVGTYSKEVQGSRFWTSKG